jgi:hypothetical protein
LSLLILNFLKIGFVNFSISRIFLPYERGFIIGKMILEEEMENKLFKVKIGSEEEFAIQFTGKGKNIREIEKFTKPIFKKLKTSLNTLSQITLNSICLSVASNIIQLSILTA